MSFFKNRTVIGVICIVLSLLICFAVTPLFNQGISQKAEIVRVIKPIKIGEVITKDMVQTVEVGAYNLPDNVLPPIWCRGITSSAPKSPMLPPQKTPTSII